MMTDDEKAELAGVYERAAEYLEEYGWQQRRSGKHGGPRCFIGATLSALDNNMCALWYTASDFAEKVLEVPMIMVWNDECGRTADEVINTLHALVNKLR